MDLTPCLRSRPARRSPLTRGGAVLLLGAAPPYVLADGLLELQPERCDGRTLGVVVVGAAHRHDLADERAVDVQGSLDLLLLALLIHRPASLAHLDVCAALHSCLRSAQVQPTHCLCCTGDCCVTLLFRSHQTPFHLSSVSSLLAICRVASRS